MVRALRIALALAFALPLLAVGASLPRWPDAQTGGSALTSPSTLAHLDTSTTLGANDPDGPIVIDRTRCTPMISGLWDNDSMANNAAADWIRVESAPPFGVGDRNASFTTAGTAAAGATALTVASSGAATDNLLCRCNGGDFRVCSTDANCTTGGGGTCEDVLIGDGLTEQVREFVVKIADCDGAGNACYELIYVGGGAGSGYNGCGGVGTTLALRNALRREIPAGSIVSPAFYDDLHHTTNMGHYEAACVLEAREEMHFPPRKNLVDNGYIEEDCTTEHWTLDNNGGAAGSLTWIDYAPHDPLAESNSACVGSAYRGSACCFQAGIANPDSWVESDAITVVSGAAYTVDMMLRSISTGPDVSVEIVDAADNDSQVSVNWYNGRGVLLPISDADGALEGTQFRRHTTNIWTPIVGEFVAPSTSIKLRFRAQDQVVTGIQWDEVEIHRSVDQDATQLAYVLGRWTPKTFRLGYAGDSSSDECEAADDSAMRGGDDLPCSMDYVIDNDSVRSDLTFELPIYDDSTVGRGGRSAARFRWGTSGGNLGANHPVNPEPVGTQQFTDKTLDPCLDDTGGNCSNIRFDAVVVEFGLNGLASTDGFTGDNSPSQQAATVAAICADLHAAGIRCVVLTETSFAGNTNATTCSLDGVDSNDGNCAEAIMEYNSLVVRGDGLGNVRGIGW